MSVDLLDISLENKIMEEGLVGVIFRAWPGVVVDQGNYSSGAQSDSNGREVSMREG